VHLAKPALLAAFASHLCSSARLRRSHRQDLKLSHNVCPHGRLASQGASCRHPLHAPTHGAHGPLRTSPRCLHSVPGAERVAGAAQPRHRRGHRPRGDARCLPEQLELLRPARRAHQGLQRRAALPGRTLAVYGLAAAAAVLVHGAVRVAQGSLLRSCAACPS
jgi:hypothetical protein